MQSCSCPQTTRSVSSPNAVSGVWLPWPCATLEDANSSAWRLTAQAWRVPVLVHEQDVEPVVGVLGGRKHFDSAVLRLAMEALVANVTHAVQRELGGSLLQKDGLDLEARPASFFVGGGGTRKFEAPEVVDEAGGREDVKSAESSFLQTQNRLRENRGSGSKWSTHSTTSLRIVVVAVDREDRQPYVHVLVLVVDVGVAARVSVSSLSPLQLTSQLTSCRERCRPRRPK